jgi:hypothetical protein
MKSIHVHVQNESEFQLFKDFEDELVEKLERNGFFVRYMHVYQNVNSPWVSFEIKSRETRKTISVEQHPIPYGNNGNIGFGRRPLHMLALRIEIK